MTQKDDKDEKKEKREMAKQAVNAKKVKEKKEELGEGNTDRTDFKVYDMPSELVNQYISMAKLYYDNQVWKVLEQGMDLLLAQRTPSEEMQNEIEELQLQVEKLKKEVRMLQAQKHEEDDVEPTFGSPSINTDEEKLQSDIENLNKLKIKSRGEKDENKGN